MKFELERERILIILQTEEDEAYIEDTLGLKNEEDLIPLNRVNVFNTGSIAYLEALKKEE